MPGLADLALIILFAIIGQKKIIRCLFPEHCFIWETAPNYPVLPTLSANFTHLNHPFVNFMVDQSPPVLMFLSCVLIPQIPLLYLYYLLNITNFTDFIVFMCILSCIIDCRLSATSTPERSASPPLYPSWNQALWSSLCFSSCRHLLDEDPFFVE